MSTKNLNIRIANNEDRPKVWSVIEPVFRAGETYAIDPKIGRGDALDYWFGEDKTTFVAEEDGIVIGTFYLRTNQGGGGSHICNCGYITSSSATGKGVARKMCEYSIEYAKSKGYLGMQFNFVVSTNRRAISLWESLEFKLVGRLPKAFNHPTEGYVDAMVMFKELNN